MSRPRLPKTVVSKGDAWPTLSKATQKEIAAALAPYPLDHQSLAALQEVIKCFAQTAGGFETTTVANVLFTLRSLGGSKRARADALAVWAHERSGVDERTYDAFGELARATLAGDQGAASRLAAAAVKRIAELEAHERVNTQTEPLRAFGAHVHAIWFHATGKLLERCTPAEAAQCRRFALAVFQAAGAGSDSLAEHPARLDEYLLADCPGA